MTTSPTTYERLGTVSIHIVLHARGRITAHGVSVSTSGKRMGTFRKSGPTPSCSCCGLEAKYFAVERHRRHLGHKKTNDGYHLNLWGVDANGREVLFTHDHTLARGLGGADNLSNTTTMCDPCNGKKAKHESAEAARRRKEAVVQ